MQKIGGFYIPNPTYNYVYRQIKKYLLELKPEKVISGMALGTDQIFAHIATTLDIPFIAAVPFEGQEAAWNDKHQAIYHRLLKKASEVIVVSPGGYENYKMQVRNCWVVDNCDLLLGVYDGSGGGTKNCLNYAQSIKKPTIIINPLDLDK